MNVFDYMNVVSGYIINKLENKKDLETSIEINIRPIMDFESNSLFYEVNETENYCERSFYLKFKCNSKEEFYSAVNNLLIEYFKNSEDLVAYYGIGPSNNYGCNKFSVFTKNRAQLSFDMFDTQDKMVFESFRDYLTGKTENTIVSKEDNLLEEESEVMSLKKIRL